MLDKILIGHTFLKLQTSPAVSMMQRYSDIPNSQTDSNKSFI